MKRSRFSEDTVQTTQTIHTTMARILMSLMLPRYFLFSLKNDIAPG